MDDLVGAAECVLFDFDGPICDLFRGHPASGIAEHMRALVERRGEAADVLTPALRATRDPQVILHGLKPDTELAVFLEDALTQQELRAARSAMPTPYADPLIRTLLATGHKVAVTTNNSPEAVAGYLATRDLDRCFAGHIHGRRADVRLLKPHPDCLERALESTGTPPEKSLMIGDTVNDLLAARAAGVPFVGYAPRPPRRQELYAAGAPYTVASLKELLELVSTPTFG